MSRIDPAPRLPQRSEPVSAEPVRPEPARPEPLRFEADRGAQRSKWIALALVVGLVGWMGSGYVLPSPEEEVAAAPAGPRAVTVAVRPSEAQVVTRTLSAEGQALPERETAVPAETSGEIAEVLVEKGARVEAGDLIARIDPAQRASDLVRAEEEERRARRELDNAQTLLDRGIGTADRVAEARAAQAAAEAGVAAAREELSATEVTAPFAGRVEALEVDPGVYVAEGAEIARIVDNAPLEIAIQVPQQSRGGLEAGREAEVRFITGEVRTGVVTFVGSSADAQTRTFLAEVEVENEGGVVPAGVSAEVRIPVGEAVAHFLSPAILSLGADGTLGVKTVDEDDRVVFHEVEIVRAETSGVWVAGLPERARVVTIGQGYVSGGEVVDPRSEEALEALAGGALPEAGAAIEEVEGAASTGAAEGAPPDAALGSAAAAPRAQADR